MLEKNSKLRKKQTKGKVNSKSLKKGWFCFVRSNKGKVLAVFHHRKEKSYVVNFKKTVTAAFQANFAKTSIAKETDPQSRHTAHYKYKKEGKDTIEYRTVNTADVSKFAGKVKKKSNVAFKSKEAIKVGANHVIREVHGTSTTSVSKVNKKEEQITGKNEDIPPIETKSDYTLRLKKCSQAKESDVSEEWAWLSSNSPIVVDDLMATYNEREHDEADMEELYEALPELEQTLQHYHKRSSHSTRHSEEDDAFLKWSHLLQLEAKYGPLKGRKPKISTLINKLDQILNVKNDISRDFRMTIYSLLSLEGSHTAQKALLSAVYNKYGTDEYDSIVMAITLLQAIEHSTLLEYKNYVMNNRANDEHLLLSLATLGRHKNVEQEVINTILMEGQKVNDTESLVHFIHALGNTGSNLIIPYLTPLLLDSGVHKDIQLTVIDALRTVSTNETVWTIFRDLINSNSSSVVTVDHVLAIIESLKFPYESFLYYPEEPDAPEDNEIFNELLSSIVLTAIEVSDPHIYNTTVSLLEHFETKLTNELMDLLMNPLTSSNVTHQRAITKRASWDSRNPIFNLISSYSSRQEDLQTYPYHKGYLWGKKLGPSKIHAKLAVGGFGGVGDSGFKVFGKGLANLYVFGRTVNVVHMEYLALVRKGRDASTKQYIKIMGSTLLKKYKQVPLPYRQLWKKNLFRMQILKFQYRIFVWIGFLNFYIQASISFDANVAFQIDWRQVSAEASIGPTFTVRGGAELTLLIFFKVGLEIKASIGYYVTPKASVNLCRTNPVSDASACFGIFHGSKGLFVDIYGFYQKKKCSFPGWKFWKLKCKWQPKKKLKLFSGKFKIGALSQRLLWGRCLACSCKRGPIHNACSAITRQQSPIAPSEAETNGLCSCKPTKYY